MNKILAVLLASFMAFKKDVNAVIDLGVVIMISIAFAALMVIGFLIYEVRDSLLPNGEWEAGRGATEAANQTWYSIANITAGFDNAVNLLLVAITIFILALAIGALLMLRGRQG